MNIAELKSRKRQAHKLSMVTCYDAWSAKILAETDVDMILVGDSSAMVMHGFADTIPSTVDALKYHVASVRRGAPKKFIVADIPFLACRGSIDRSLHVVQELFHAGAHAVKIEGFDAANAQLVQHLVESGVPVMGHLGLTPQFVNAFGGFKVQGRGEEQRQQILAQARGLQEAGAFALVLECVPQSLAREITSALLIPTIGIGAGSGCDGQVLVLHDLAGFTTGFKPRFVRTYMDGANLLREAVQNYHADVLAGRFPNDSESYE